MAGEQIFVDPRRFLEAYLEEALEHLEQLEAALLRLESSPHDPQHIDEVFRAAHSIKGGAATFGLPEIARFTHAFEGVLARVRSGSLPATSKRIALFLRATDVTRRMLAFAGSDEPCTAPVEAVLAELMREPDADATPPSEPLTPAETAPAAAGEASSVRVPIEKIDALMNLAGELVIAQSMVSQCLATDGVFDLREAIGELERRTRELQERVMAIRMVPLSLLLGRFPRVVRDLSAALDKRVVLEVEGAETELDRGLIEHITDPLTHLVRNAVDHGLESAEERRAAGKPEHGTVTITAGHQGGSIVIDVADDGRGLDPRRLRARALELGVAAPDEELGDEESLELILRPGFSTATSVTGISGRGVGMDVVNRNISALNGTLRIRSTVGAGTTFRLTLPLTLAILDGLSLTVGHESYVLPLVAIVESLRVPPGGLKSVAGRGETVVVRGEVLPLLRLNRLFGLPPGVVDPRGALIVIVEHDGRRAALMVDEVSGQVQAVIKNLEQNYGRVDGVMGATILGNGRVALILDVAGLLRLSSAPRRAPAPTQVRA